MLNPGLVSTERWFDLAGNWDDPAKFVDAVKALHLSKQQTGKLLQLRELWTENVRRCIDEPCGQTRLSQHSVSYLQIGNCFQ